MAIAERAAVAALRHRLHQRRALVQRIQRQAEHDRALRPEDGEVPELGDPRRRRHCAQHERDARRQPGDREQPGQSGRADRGEIEHSRAVRSFPRKRESRPLARIVSWVPALAGTSGTWFTARRTGLTSRQMAKVCDCFPALKEVTDARERRYRAHPEKPAPEGPQSFVEVKVTSIGELNELVECKRSGFKFVISEPAHVGGQNCAPSPLEFGCYAAVFAFYAAKLGIAYDGFEAVARTEFDARGHMMIADAPTSAFCKVTISLRVMS